QRCALSLHDALPICFMSEVERECTLLGIPVKTRHNEVAPNQFELASVFEEANLAVDHNQLLMDVMEEVAARHDFTVLFHEKPFADRKSTRLNSSHVK